MKIIILVFVFGFYCVEHGMCQSLGEMVMICANSLDPDEMLRGNCAYNCTGTFYATDYNIIESPENGASGICIWRITALPGDRFRLQFERKAGSRCGRRIENLLVRDGRKQVFITTCDFIETETNVLWIQYFNRPRQLFSSVTKGFYASVEIVTSRLTYTLHTSPQLSWRGAMDYCEANGGTLAVSYPARTSILNSILKQQEMDIWQGEFMSQWAWLRGCVVWPNKENRLPAYSQSKYNQFTECSWACLGHVYFLLQNMLCYCLNEIVSEESTVYRECNIPCPGDSTEPCGGRHTFTKYQYMDYKDAVDEDFGGDCLSTDIRFHLKPTKCTERLRFTCEFLNGTSVTFSQHLTWVEARDFCGTINSSVGLKAVPKFEFEEHLWTSALRKVDWNFPTVARRMPAYSNTMQKTSEEYAFICQHENITCGENITGEGGVVTSPGYPDSYIINQYCVWLIEVSEDMVVQLDWKDMNLEDSDTCIYDYIEIQEYPKEVKGRYCGKEKPASFISKTSSVTIMFKSDSTATGGGFRLVWKPVEPLPDSEESLGRKSGPSGGVVVAITMSLTAVVAGVIVAVVIVVRRMPRKNTFNVTKTKSPGVSNAIYGTSFEEDSEFSSVSKAYQNVSQRRGQNGPNAEANQTPDDGDYENVQKPLDGANRKASSPQGSAENTKSENIAELATLGIDSINVVSTEASDETMDSHEYMTVPEKLTSSGAHNMYIEQTNGRPSIFKGSAAESGENAGGIDNLNVYHEIGNDGTENGYLEPIKSAAPIYIDIV